MSLRSTLELTQLASIPLLVGLLAGAWVNFARHRAPAVAAALCIIPGIWELVRSEIHGSVCPGGECIADGFGLVLALGLAFAALGFLAAGGLHTLAKDDSASATARRAAKIAKPLLIVAAIVLMASHTTFWPLKSREDRELTRELHAVKPDPQPVTIRGTTYRFPRRNISEMLLPPKHQTVFIRLHSPSGGYDLVLDELSQSAQDSEGPKTSRLMDDMIGKPSVVLSPAGPLLCDETIRGRFICGLTVKDGPVRWNVVFDQGRARQAEQIRSEAGAEIRSYHPNG